jgi:alpha-D-xyloside xylohydrolase
MLIVYDFILKKALKSPLQFTTLLERNIRNRDNLKEFTSALCIDAREYSPIPGTNDFRLTLRFEPGQDEKIFGMGQYQQPYLDLKNCTLELAHRNSQASVPFMISNLGYGFLWNNPAVGRADRKSVV